MPALMLAARTCLVDHRPHSKALLQQLAQLMLVKIAHAHGARLAGRICCLQHLRARMQH